MPLHVFESQKQQKIGLILVRFHQDQVQSMRDEACRAAVETGMEVVKEVWIPGSMEAPLAAKRLLVQQDVDGLVVLGIIERGETKHGLVMSQAVTHALIDLQLSFMKPIGIGILGPEIFPSQIASRVRSSARSATMAVHHMLQI
jgi:6,7-dimethyl-8-ribityllumazine synthase